jgi:hypothetical protein
MISFRQTRLLALTVNANSLAERGESVNYGEHCIAPPPARGKLGGGTAVWLHHHTREDLGGGNSQ